MNIKDMNKGQLRRHVHSLCREEDRLLEPYDCGQSLAEYMGPPRIREIRLELEALEIEAGRRLAMEAAGAEYEQQHG